MENTTKTKEFPSLVGLCLASYGIATTTQFDPVFGAISYVLGWDIFTHELAEKTPWRIAGERVRSHDPILEFWANKLQDIYPEMQKDKGAWPALEREFLDNYGPACQLPKGTGERQESPLESLERIAPGKPVVVVKVD